ncbi:MAG: TonB-dependent receptor [Flavobacteriales bacterium]|nr:TonB-dependent receptor [Flavobacteriales bacterium]
MRHLIFPLFLFLSSNLLAQTKIFQTIRGTVIDQDSKSTIPGANVIVIGSDPILGASSDMNGKFKIENVPVGRVSLKITFLGYENKVIPNIQLSSAREAVFEVELQESLVKLDVVEVKAKKNKAEVLNDMALLSARTFSVEETNRYAGSLNDPARMVSAFAGVAADAEGDNNIVVRGNSSKGILWRLEGVEIPNPNHFSEEGYTGGPINALNSDMLANSDFFSGAFAPEYGNAYSGVFDMKLRTGNNEKRQYGLSAGVLGIDFTAEGPFSSGSQASYLVNYRYSSLALLDNLGIVDFSGVPKYQDASFKLHLPTEKAGVFSIFGLGGYSTIDQEGFNESEDTLMWSGVYNSHMGVVGLNHSYLFNEKTYLKSSLSMAKNGSEDTFNWRRKETDVDLTKVFEDGLNKTTSRATLTLNHKFNARHKLQVSGTYSHYMFNFKSEYLDDELNRFITELDRSGDAGHIQSFVSWKYRINEKLTMVSGAHYMHFLLNSSNSVEPRLALKWKLDQKQSLSTGFGIHSRLESLTGYFSVLERDDGTSYTPNRNVELAKAQHYVVGYENRISDNLNFKTEIYYQSLYDVPVANDTSSSYSILNTSGGFDNVELVNKGTGQNYGVELTLERFFANSYFFLITGSLYESKYTALDGVKRNTRFNGNYASNVLIGKEFNIGKEGKNKTLTVSTKFLLIGGQRYVPIDLNASIAADETVRVWEKAYEPKASDVFKIDFALIYRNVKPRSTQSFKLDIQNVTNNQAATSYYFNSSSGQIENNTQLPLLPVLSYKIEF